MTDAELAKAVADACGIEVYHHQGGVSLRSGSGHFDPANDWNAAMHAAEKCRLFAVHAAKLDNTDDARWRLSFWNDDGVKKVFRNDSGPRAICEAILAVKGVKA